LGFKLHSPSSAKFIKLRHAEHVSASDTQKISLNHSRRTLRQAQGERMFNKGEQMLIIALAHKNIRTEPVEV